MTLKKLFSINSDVKEGWSVETKIHDKNGLYIEVIESEKAIEKYGNKTVLEWCSYDDCIALKLK